ncbi:MAG TPA: hypothetical protein VLV78_08605 [Thermoanaerobaculia bacterium]|nr:hypothetical protein [Thermoanaerobaculia bacterium]
MATVRLVSYPAEIHNMPWSHGGELAFAASWREHRRQRIAIATTRSLLDLNAGDLAEERHAAPATAPAPQEDIR